VWSIAADSIGAYLDDASWNAPRDIDRVPQRLWSWSDNQLANPLRQSFNLAVIALHGLPTSQTVPELLSASYRVNPPPSVTTIASKPIEFSLEAANGGQVVWLASSPSDKGVVHLGWCWFKEGQDTPLIKGRSPLSYDVYPQQSYEFRCSIDRPRQPGTYLPELDRVNEHVSWFSDVRVPPIRLTVRVEP